jgi:hypothetical protein
MKKISTLLLACVMAGNFVQAQSQRVVLLEEFTGETCGPCASQNPAFNALLDANSSIAVSLKYQNNIPSTGPNFYLYNTADIANRTTYYANNYSPHGFMDGNVWNNTVGNFNATLLNARAAITSPFEINVTHSFSPAYDIIYTHTVVRATQAVTGMNQLKLRVAVSEQDIYGYTSPNGESHYQHVMRKMLPDGNGTTLPANWNVGDSTVIDLQWTITTNANPVIYKPYWAMLEAVAFVQTDDSKEVMQAGISRADQSILVDAAITAATAPSITCNNSFTPTITLKNWKGNPVTSVDIEYGMQGTTLSTYSWTGSLAAGATAIVNGLSTINLSGTGAQTFVANITSVNGNPYLVNVNNNKTITVAVPTAPTTSFSEGFTATAFPPTNWLINNPDQGATWVRSTAGGFGTSTGSAKMDFYNSLSGNIDEMFPYTPIDLTNATNPAINFNVAYAQYQNENDRLELRVSTDCGVTWTSLYNKSGTTLSTAPAQTAVFTPTAAQWRAEQVSLTSYIGQPSVLISFKATSAYGNNAYVDDINLTGVTGINTIESLTALELYPNPASSKVTINASFEKMINVVISINDITGRQVMKMECGNIKNLNKVIDVSSLAKGTYTVGINADGAISYKKLTVE